MKYKSKFTSLLTSLAFATIFTIFCCFPIAAQINSDAEDRILSPSEETFQKATDLIAPWRSSGCPIDILKVHEKDCYRVNGKEWDNSVSMNLYNADGSLWYNFSLDNRSPDYFPDNMKSGFMPFATYPALIEAVILRIVGESAHWYEVEVNEETRATKFVLKSDAMWAKVKWSRWLSEMKYFQLNADQSLLDKPNGKIIEQSPTSKYGDVRYLKDDGDWAYVEYKDGRFGWIRWRKGRDILVNDVFKRFVISRPKQNQDKTN